MITVSPRAWRSSSDLLLKVIDVLCELHRHVSEFLVGAGQVRRPRLEVLVDWLLGNAHAHPALQQLDNLLANAHPLSFHCGTSAVVVY